MIFVYSLLSSHVLSFWHIFQFLCLLKHIYFTTRKEARTSLTYLEVAALHPVTKMTEN